MKKFFSILVVITMTMVSMGASAATTINKVITNGGNCGVVIGGAVIKGDASCDSIKDSLSQIICPVPDSNTPSTDTDVIIPEPDNNTPSVDTDVIIPQPDNNAPSVDTDTNQPETDNDAPSTDSGVAQPETDNDAPSTDSSLHEFEKEVIRLVNEIRVKNGLRELTLDTELSHVARIKSQDMKDNKYFSHTSPTYGSPFDMLKKFGISYRSAGENIARGQATPQTVVNGWMNSEGHRANILNASYTAIGVGYVAEGNYWTQLFIGR